MDLAKEFINNTETTHIHLLDLCKELQDLIQKFRNKFNLDFNKNKYLVQKEELQAALIYYKINL